MFMCLLCNLNCVEVECYFFIECFLYKEKKLCFYYILIFNKIIMLLIKYDKFIWLMFNEDRIIIIKFI